MNSIAIAIIAKTPEPGKSKTRLSPPLLPEQCAEISACFIADLSENIDRLQRSAPIAAYALYTPVGSEDRLRGLLPQSFGLVPQTSGDLGARLFQGISDLLSVGHGGAIIVSSDSPTLPATYFKVAAEKLLAEDCVVLCPALDGGYTFIGLSRPHPSLFEDIPWSTEHVHRLTVERAAEIGLRVYNFPTWYDVDDAATLAILRDDLNGDDLPFDCDEPRMPAPRTAAFLTALDTKTVWRQAGERQETSQSAASVGASSS